MEKAKDLAGLSIGIALWPVLMPGGYIYYKAKAYGKKTIDRKKAKEIRDAEEARFYHDWDVGRDVSHQSIMSKTATTQSQCILFRVPAEIRMIIFSMVITDYEEPHPAEKERWSRTQPFFRPEFTSRRRQDTALCRTCRAIYVETWHLPHLLKEQVWWIKADDYKEYLNEATPPGYSSFDQYRLLCQTIKRMKALRGYADYDRPDPYLEETAHGGEGSLIAQKQNLEIADLRIFIYPRKLERLFFHAMLSTKDFHPRRITLTIRHPQWNGWKTDEPLFLPGAWIASFCRMLSSSTREVIIELETVARKKHQVNYIAAQISQSWFFKRPDGAVLHADATEGMNSVSRWTGSSILGSRPQRWIRDEVAEGKIEYAIVRVPFVEPSCMPPSARVSLEAQELRTERMRNGIHAPGQPIDMTEAEAAPKVSWKAGDWPGWEHDIDPYRPDFVNYNFRPAWRTYQHHHWDRW